MMPSPSAAILTNLVDISAAVPTQDVDGGLQFTYPSVTQAGVPCSVQYRDSGEDDTTFGRITMVNFYHILFASNPNLNPRDQIVWRDEVPNRTLIVQANPPSEAGRQSTWVVRAVERA